MILATICCRGGSKGVPGKNIKLIKGKPLIAYTIEEAKKSRYINELIISTDDTNIANVALSFGANVPFMRPADLASDTASKWPVFIHAVETYEQLTGNTVAYLVDLDVTVPLKSYHDIDGAIKMALEDTETDVVITGYEPERNPYFNMMEIGEDGFASIVKKSALYKYYHWSNARCKIYEIPRKRAVDIDTEIDFKIVEFFIDYNQ